MRPLLAGSLLPRIPSWTIHADGPVSSQVTAPTVAPAKGSSLSSRPVMPRIRTEVRESRQPQPPTVSLLYSLCNCDTW